MNMIRELEEALQFIWCVEFWRMGVFWTISLIASYLQLFFKRILFTRCADVYPHCLPSTSGSVKPLCIITGPTSGLGQATALALSRKGFFVVLAGRSFKSLYGTVERIKRHNKDAQLKAFEVDLSSFQSILKFKDSLEKWLLDSDMHSSIQLLINNAGILATTHRVTAEGYDQMMSTNYIGAFSLTKILLPLLRNSPVGSRIVNVTSFTHRSVCMLLFTYQLHQQIHSVDKSCQVSVNAADPGAVETNIMREVPSCLRHMSFIVLKLLGLLQSSDDGASAVVDAALAPPETSGVYFFGGKGRSLNSSGLSRNLSLSEKLWTTSVNLFEEFASKEKERHVL